ncbi:hypothetical protein ABMY26_00930 (plasmid) [Azospirillum sp. HJ39]|uniref:hypothetical protein n=1 Tax=Azospirillum sp. HJ39 TaxID=3159496 RepID=UPI003556FC5A
MDDAAARLLAFRYMASTDRRAADVYRWCRRLLGHRDRARDCNALWSDAFDLLVVLIADSETFAAGIARRVAVAERAAAKFDQDRTRATA